MSDNSNIIVLTTPAEIAFCNLFEKKVIPGGNREQWDLTVLVAADSPDLAALKKLSVALYKAKFPRDYVAEPLRKDEWQIPWEAGEDFIDRMRREKGDKAPDNSFMVGKALIKSHSALYAPNLSVLVGGDVKDYRDAARDTCKDKFYPGCLVLAEFNAQTHKVGKNLPGVTLYLNKVCSLNKGERRGGGRSGAETFGGYVGRITGGDATAGAEEKVAY